MALRPDIVEQYVSPGNVTGSFVNVCPGQRGVNCGAMYGQRYGSSRCGRVHGDDQSWLNAFVLGAFHSKPHVVHSTALQGAQNFSLPSWEQGGFGAGWSCLDMLHTVRG